MRRLLIATLLLSCGIDTPRKQPTTPCEAAQLADERNEAREPADGERFVCAGACHGMYEDRTCPYTWQCHLETCGHWVPDEDEVVWHELEFDSSQDVTFYCIEEPIPKYAPQHC